MEKKEILERLQKALIEEFQMEESKVVPEARLYEDLGLDSIDAVDLIVKLKSMLPRNIDPEVFKSVHTLQDVADAIYDIIQQPEMAQQDVAALEAAALKAVSQDAQDPEAK